MLSALSYSKILIHDLVSDLMIHARKKDLVILSHQKQHAKVSCSVSLRTHKTVDRQAHLSMEFSR